MCDVSSAAMREAALGVLDEQAEQVRAEKPLDERLVVLGRANDLGERADEPGSSRSRASAHASAGDALANARSTSSRPRDSARASVRRSRRASSSRRRESSTRTRLSTSESASAISRRACASWPASASRRARRAESVACALWRCSRICSARSASSSSSSAKADSACSALEESAAVVFEQLAVAADLGGDAREFVVGGHARLAHGLGLAAQLVELPVERLEARVGLAALRRERLELAGARRAARLGLVQLLAQLGEPGDEVLALLLEQEQPGVEALEDRLHAATLLGEVADEQPLLLEQRLELLELALLLGEAVAREVDVGVGFLLALGELVPRRLQAAQVVDGERELELAQLGDELGVLLGLGRLALERTELAVDLAGDVACALEVRVHGAELAQRALLALLVLEDAGGLFDERAAVFGAGVQDLVEAALADDRVRVAAQGPSRAAGPGCP